MVSQLQPLHDEGTQKQKEKMTRLDHGDDHGRRARCHERVVKVECKKGGMVSVDDVV